MYLALNKTILHYTPVDLTALDAVAVENISAGNNNVGSSAFVAGTGLRVRNKVGGTLLTFQNVHSFATAYARILTTRTFYSLGVADLDLVIPADSRVYAVGGFTNLFHASGTLEENLTPSTVVERSYADFIEVMLAHDASDPTAALRFKAYYL